MSQHQSRPSPQHCETRLATVFQPIADLRKGTHLGYEALARPLPPTAWRSPAALFDPSNDGPENLALEQRAIAGALRESVGLPIDALVFINCSPAAVRAGLITEAFRDAPEIDPSRVVVEITEGTTQDNDVALAAGAAELRAIGCSIAIDDVGSGASGLNRVVALRPDWVKIDRQLMTGIDSDEVRQNTVRLLLHIARSVGARVILEGIEREAELAIAMRLGAQYAQGFLLGRPAQQAAGLTAETSARLEAWRAEADSQAATDPRLRPIGELTEPPVVVDIDATVRDAAAILLQIIDAPGCVVVDAGEPQGWLSRAHTLSISRGPLGTERVAALIDHQWTIVDPALSLIDALALAADRPEAKQGEPVVVWSPSTRVGIVTAGRLLGEASRLARAATLRATPTSGLPGRIEAEAHLRTLMRETELARWGAVDARLRHDAAIARLTGIEGLAERAGWNVADELTHQTAALLRTRLAAEDPGSFVAEIDNGRYVMTASPEALGRTLPDIIDRLTKLTGSFSQHTHTAEVVATVDHLPDVVRRLASPSELFAMSPSGTATVARPRAA